MDGDQLTCGSCLQTLPKAKFFRKQRNKGVYARCPRCANRDTPIHPEVERQLQRARDQKELEWKLEKQKREQELMILGQTRTAHPAAPPHPDKGKAFGCDQSFEVKSGGFCFGLRHDVQEAAQERLMTFEDITRATHTKKRFGGGGTIANNTWASSTVALNGTWNAYKLVTRNDYHGEYTSGYIICHESRDALHEARQLICHTVPEHNGGNSIYTGTGGTSDYQTEMGLAAFPRYIIGTTYDLDEKEASKVLDEGLYVVDYEQAQTLGVPSKTWKNALRGLHTGGDFVLAGYSSNAEGLCQSLLLYGRCDDFASIYFVDGTAPLGQRKWQDGCFCPEHQEGECSISLEKYLKASETVICEMQRKKRKALEKAEREATEVRLQKKITSFFKPKS